MRGKLPDAPATVKPVDAVEAGDEFTRPLGGPNRLSRRDRRRSKEDGLQENRGRGRVILTGRF